MRHLFSPPASLGLELIFVILFRSVRVDELKTSLAPTRSALLSVLASLFPIEMREAGELLFTIVDVPLPIPVAATDPAPPLSVVGQRDVNEESVATALGYAAQLVQMAAGYLGKGLVYPVTYVGSRSLIRDGISAMVGPRMYVSIFHVFSTHLLAYRPRGFPCSRKGWIPTALSMGFSC